MKKYKRIKLLAAIISPIVVVPTLVSCSRPTHINFLANYVNSLDATSLLGIAPDYFLSNYKDVPNNKFLDFTYLSNAINTSKTNIQRIPIADGKEVNIKGISRLEPYSILFNEWERVDEKKFWDIIPNIAYTSMGDSENKSRWWSDDKVENNLYGEDTSMYRFYKGKSNEEFEYQKIRVNDYKDKDSGVSPQKALLMAAQDLDRIYKLDNKLTNRANNINKLFKQRVQNITSNEAFKTFASVTNKTNRLINTNLDVGIIIGGEGVDDSSSFKFLTPNALPLFYSQQDGKGLGFNFPDPGNGNNTNEWRSSRYIDTFIFDTDGGQSLLNTFKSKFDYLIYVQSMASTLKNSQAYLDLSSFAPLLKEDQQPTYRIYKTTYFKFYDAIWGMYGYNFILDELINNMIPQFMKAPSNKNSPDNKLTNLETLKQSDEKFKINLIPKESYLTLRPDTTSQELTDWNYSKNNNEKPNI